MIDDIFHWTPIIKIAPLIRRLWDDSDTISESSFFIVHITTKKPNGTFYQVSSFGKGYLRLEFHLLKDII